ncbi:MAG: ribosome biogenesis GTP-binding protein YihA/YsxC [Luteolibacter sp.]
MKIRTATFITSATSLEGCPEWPHREFALIGRSNVGKSSLINLLAWKPNLAKVSATPGKTRELNFFLMNECWGLTDLPGYGYAKISREKKADFLDLVADYIEQRENLEHLFILIDSRLDPQKIDLDFIQWIQSVGVRYSLIFTKTDKQSPGRTQANVATFIAALPTVGIPPERTFLTSSAKKSGSLEILDFIAKNI